MFLRSVSVATALFGVLVPAYAVAASATDAQSPESPVVLELFTSQGCSSCPAAEQVLSFLGSDESLRARVVPLAFHVDYWNEGGWVDPFSRREWSMRQSSYASALGLDSSYTPQLVVNGQAQFNGGDSQRALREIAARLEQHPAAAIDLSVQKSEGPRLAVDVAVEITKGFTAGRLDLVVVLFESGLATPVAGGENRGRTLHNDFIVRRLETAFSLPPRAGARRRRTMDLKLDAAWKPENLGASAFLQDPGSMRIYGATAPRSIR